jgi:hypothetical protein
MTAATTTGPLFLLTCIDDSTDARISRGYDECVALWVLMLSCADPARSRGYG